MYIDGVSQTVTPVATPTGTVNTAAADLKLGNRTESDRAIDGALADFAFYDGVILTQAQISAHAKGFSADMVGHVRPTWYVELIRNVQDKYNAGTPTVTGTTVTAHPRIIYPKRKRIWSVPAAAAPPKPSFREISRRPAPFRPGIAR